MGPTSLLAHHLVSGSDIICNRLSPLLADIVWFGPLRITVRLTIFKTCLVERDFYTLIRNVSLSSLTDVKSHKWLDLYNLNYSL